MPRTSGPKSKTTKTAPSLIAFAHNKRVAERQRTCLICRLPSEIRFQIRTARTRKIDRSTMVEWLAKLGQKVDDLDFQTHYAGLHEQREIRGPGEAQGSQ